MIIGTGVDIAEVKRIAAALKQPGFAVRIFTPAENAYCLARKKAPASFAARWAAKEAMAKALGTGIGRIGWREIEVVVDGNGKPGIILTGAAAGRAEELGVSRIHLSLSHSVEHAVAFVILEKDL